jgi:hypothetical protein
MLGRERETALFTDGLLSDSEANKFQTSGFYVAILPLLSSFGVMYSLKGAIGGRAESQARGRAEGRWGEKAQIGIRGDGVARSASGNLAPLRRGWS